MSTRYEIAQIEEEIAAFTAMAASMPAGADKIAMLAQIATKYTELQVVTAKHTSSNVAIKEEWMDLQAAEVKAAQLAYNQQYQEDIRDILAKVGDGTEVDNLADAEQMIAQRDEDIAMTVTDVQALEDETGMNLDDLQSEELDILTVENRVTDCARTVVDATDATELDKAAVNELVHDVRNLGHQVTIELHEQHTTLLTRVCAAPDAESKQAILELFKAETHDKIVDYKQAVAGMLEDSGLSERQVIQILKENIQERQETSQEPAVSYHASEIGPVTITPGMDNSNSEFVFK